MKKTLTTIFLTACALCASATDYYVSPNGAGTKDGTSWENAWDLATFQDKASESNAGTSFANRDNIYFAGGKYACTTTIWIRWGLNLYGATTGERTIFTGDTDADGVANRDRLIRIVPRNNADRFVTIENIEFEKYTLNQPSTLTTDKDDFVITNGVGVISANLCSATVTIRNCHFRDITNTGNGGGAILARTANLVVENCTFKNISASSRGAVMRLTSGSINKGVTTVNNCLFYNCSITTTTNEPGGMIMLQHGETLTISNSVFRNNSSAGKGGAIYLGKHETSYSRDLILNNCLMYDNTATGDGAAVFFGDSKKSITCTNCLIDAEDNSNTQVVPAMNISGVGAGTYYIGAPFTMPTGVTGKTFSDIAGTTLTVGTTYAAGDVVPAGTALLIEGEEGKYYPTITTSDASAPTNMLSGSDLGTTTTGEGKHYKLANGESGLAFYYGTAEGAPFSSAAHKAWLVVPDAEAEARFFFSFSDDVVTGVECITKQTTPQDGKFMENGRMVILKNGVKYNAVGQKL